uniref:Uncharacterized protein n=1 Tax=Ananas comosus var. bracteatus TaxID=296719 RepID=A0A6V7Q6Q3_ANACO|nr:unnamed protein product [Ananas comosus var. bracteatus]
MNPLLHLGVEGAPLDPLDLLDAYLVDAEGGEGLHDGVSTDDNVHLAQLLVVLGADHAAGDLREVGDSVGAEEKWSTERDPRPSSPPLSPRESSRLALWGWGSDLGEEVGVSSWEREMQRKDEVGSSEEDETMGGRCRGGSGGRIK